MNIISLAPVHPCRETIIQSSIELQATLMWADDEMHFHDLLAVNSTAFGIMTSGHKLVPEALLVRQVLRNSLLPNPVYVLLLGKGSDYKSIARSLNAGADQAETWPIESRLLTAQIKAIVGRDRGDLTEIIRFGGVEFNTTTGDVVGKTGRVHLTRVEGALLATLTRFPNRPLTKAFLHRTLYNGEDGPNLKIVDVFVCKLRKKLGVICREEHIETMWAQGFRFHVDGFVPEITEMRVVTHRKAAAE